MILTRRNCYQHRFESFFYFSCLSHHQLKPYGVRRVVGAVTTRLRYVCSLTRFCYLCSATGSLSFSLSLSFLVDYYNDSDILISRCVRILPPLEILLLSLLCEASHIRMDGNNNTNHQQTEQSQ